MFLKNELKKIVLKNQEYLKKDLGIIRDFNLKIINKFVTIISGIRRCGKSTLVKQSLKGKKPIYYINFEDISLAEFELKDFIQLEKISIETLGKNGIFFFDEIQNIKKWENYIRNLVDRNEKVIITGSNANMLSKELGTKLTGRHITQELFTFSYNEFLKLKNKKHNMNLFKEYLRKGGFPEYLKSDDDIILKNLFHDIFYRDILQRNEIRSETQIKSLLYYLISNIGKEVSYNKLKNLINVGSTNTIIQFMNHFKQSYLVFGLKKYDFSVKKQLINPKKIYCIDNGIIVLNSFSFSENIGRLLENLIFIELKRKGHEIYYHKQKNECDFLIKERLKITSAIQVCYILNDENKKREIDGLIDAMKNYNLNSGLILTYEQEDELIIDNKKISIKPVWKWLLE
ncbi:MAG: ATP-binding protein [Candidatus Woesearchaeota archaeon]